VVLVGAGADEIERRAVLGGARAHEAADLHLVERVGNPGQRLDAQLLRDLVEQVFDLFSRRWRRASARRHRVCAD
jgi:hypothetical protein